MKHIVLSLAAALCFTVSSFGQSIVAGSDHPRLLEHVHTTAMHAVADAAGPAGDVLAVRRAGMEAESGHAIVVPGGNEQVFLKTFNGCGIGNFLIPSAGDVTQGLPPMLGALSGRWPSYEYRVLDTIPGTHIKGVAFQRYPISTSILMSWKPYIVVSDAGTFSYLPGTRLSVTSQDSLERYQAVFLPGIVKLAKHVTADISDPVVLLLDNPAGGYIVRTYSYPDLTERFSIDFHVMPEIFEVSGNTIFATGRGADGRYTLYRFSAAQDSLIAAYTLDDAASNAREFLEIGASLFLLSTPGDSIVVLTTIHTADGTRSQHIVHSGAGARATHNEYQNTRCFTFQPLSDTTASDLDKQILILDPLTGSLDTLYIHRRLDYFKYAPPVNRGHGAFDMRWVAATWNDGLSDSVFISNWNHSEIAHVQTGATPRYIDATLVCSFMVDEVKPDRISFDVFPNPASSAVAVYLTGLETGVAYTFHIADSAGRLHYTSAVRAYQTLQLPVHTLSRGMYYLILETGNGVITQKMIVQ
jgi:hypothetical protein